MAAKSSIAISGNNCSRSPARAGRRGSTGAGSAATSARAGNERCDEIAVAFATGQPPDLYRGPLGGYSIDVLTVPDQTSVPKRSGASSGRSGSKAPAYSYLSVVDGVLMRHQTWTDCERRVKGRAGARFKKATSAADEAAILREWGIPGQL